MSRKQLLGVTTSVIEISGVLQHIAAQLAFSDFLRQILLSALELLLGMVNLWQNMGVSENSVSLNPMVNDHYPY